MKLTSWYYPLAAALLLVYGCARNPYATTNKAYRQQTKTYAATIRQQPFPVPTDSAALPQYWVGTVNFNLRKPNFVIIHHTAQNSCEQTLKTFTNTATQVSAHYVICRNGTIHHMLNDYLRAWHGGVARWGSVTDINSSSIGIELDNNGFEPFAPAQIHSLEILLDTLRHKYNIPTANFIGHGDIAPGRKVDPSAWFPWQQLAQKGFGLWFKDTATITLPQNFNHLQALRIVGYDIKDTSAAILAFKRHFTPADSTSGTRLDTAAAKIIFSLAQQSQ
ncbi:N-acetylmuramoyl-L-alanine amidase [Chitinophaga pendula]|uniref:N-acetylmuramoyl-L-alanine amidase n=1 Tax=Chitinophaga TaxID=79328 RepID=UPI000BAEDB69|nr:MULTISPECIES: N-acetylmuramoyl-L-alanine amidase [Chitinophaga]ASZ11027.1 N-acetylmuramoyl-L-alanine amidase [Chitinophaga sp. MD30]UCJ05977.1 N-acetylmuramoyl-L-alanine amidase [Chitinophaga pendula]